METALKPTITVEATIGVTVEAAWESWTSPRAIVRWNSASPDWHSPRAQHDLRPGGSFTYRMEAKDGSFGFDFSGVFDEVKPNEYLEYTLGDGRKVKITFTAKGNQTHISETFEAEDINPPELQKQGWQAILDNFKNFTEAMVSSIYPCITLKGKMTEASEYYVSVFGDGEIISTSPFATQFKLSGQKFLILNDGPESLPNPSISFMVYCEHASETEQYWNLLIEGGSALMPLDSYDWSPKYGWIVDKYGVSWQLFTGNTRDQVQKFCPTLMFTGANAGKAFEAINFYTGTFPQSSVQDIMNYSESDGDTTGFIKHAGFKIKNFSTKAMDSSFDHGFAFNDAISLVVECKNQEEIDTYWNALTSGGGKEIACGWLTDKYGLSWQIIPQALGKLLSDPERLPGVMNSLMKMKKLIIADLENA